MRRETTDLIGSGLLLAALLTALFATLAPPAGASVATPAPAAGPTAVLTSAAAERGRSLFYAKGCVGCHLKQGEAGRISVGPDLTGLGSRAAERRPGTSAEAYVRESLRTPSAFLVPGYQAVMPDLGLNDAEIDALSAFLLDTTQ